MVKEIILKIEPNASRILKHYGLTLDYYSEIVSSGGSIKSHLNTFSQNKIAKLHKELFPGKPKHGTILNWLTTFDNQKLCKSCSTFKLKTDFRLNKSNYDGLNSHCKSCHSYATSGTQPSRQARYRANKLQRTPKWANLDKIQEIYNCCPDKYQVDHIIPLSGEFVSGLHVENNLQYLTALDNQIKGNKLQ